MSSLSKVLTTLEQIRFTCKSTKLILPQIAVIGDQSSGKSSLLSELSGIPFPEAAKLCTRCPIVVHTRKSESPNIYMINDETIKHDELTKKIISVQKDIVKNDKVSETPITIYAEGIDMEDLVLVDLPGIIHTNGGKNEVLSLIKTYIEHDQTLILVITEATRDEETALALQLAEDADPSRERTLRILTKFDKFDSPEKRSEAVSRITEGSGFLKPHAVICRPDGKCYDSQAEQSNLGKLIGQGIPSLKKRLPSLLCKRIEMNLPLLKQQVREKLEESNQCITNLGEHELTKTQVLIHVQNKVKGEEFDLSIYVQETVNKLRKTGKFGLKNNKIFVEQMVDKLYKHDLFTCPLFQGEKTFNKCLQEIVEIWRPILVELRRLINGKLNKFLPDLKGISKNLNTNIREGWNDHCRSMMKDLEGRMDTALKKESKYSTVNHYLTAKYENHILYSSRVKETIINAMECSTFCSSDAPKYEVRTLDEIRKNIKKIINDALETEQSNHARLGLECQHKEKVVAMVKANTDCALKTMCDNIMSAIQEVIYEGKNQWVDVILFQMDGASEDEFTKSERKKHMKTIKEMKECTQLLKSI
jgi:GTP-binding protein EngB required for normal cell division